MAQAYAGAIELKLDGRIYHANGNFTYRPLVKKREMVEDVNGIAGYKEMAQTAMIEGEIKVTQDVDLKALYDRTVSTVTLTLVGGKVWVMNNAVFTEEGMSETEEGKTKIKFESIYEMRQI